jgi:Zn finger protein HypA/HybF involved in hydrogenase expression
MKCRFCGKETKVTCICGFCPECNSKYSHIELNNLIQVRKFEEREKNENIINK